MEIAEGKNPVISKNVPVLAVLAERFMSFLENARLAEESKRYLRNGWRLLQRSAIVKARIDRITAEDINALVFPGGPYNHNCALKTLRRMLHQAQYWGFFTRVPKISLMKEPGRTLRLDDEAEAKLLSSYRRLLDNGDWNHRQYQLMHDVTIMVRDTGMRNRKELLAVRIEDLDFKNGMVFIPDSKTAAGRRYVPMTDRVWELLLARRGERKEGWLFEASSTSGHLTTVDKKFRQARRLAGLSEKLVLYCGRHDYGTRVLQKTGNLAVVMRVMGHSDPKIAMRYQHPELDQVRQVLNAGNTEAIECSNFTAHFTAQSKNLNSVSD